MKGLGRRRKRIRKVQKTIPPIYKRYFTCPQCGRLTLTVSLRKVEGKSGVKIAEVLCGSCGFRCYLEVPDVVEKIDVYNMVADMLYSGDTSRCKEEPGEVLEGEGVEGEGSELFEGEETEE
ncbi:MAG: hypothetical protein F7B17_07900 [Desulfurococcales archaeon]|nr:hypothetical protein [Desulfurococcales archaeon]